MTRRYFAVEDKLNQPPELAQVVVATYQEGVAHVDDTDWVTGTVEISQSGCRVEVDMWYSPRGKYEIFVTEADEYEAIRMMLAGAQYFRRTHG